MASETPIIINKLKVRYEITLIEILKRAIIPDTQISEINIEVNAIISIPICLNIQIKVIAAITNAIGINIPLSYSTSSTYLVLKIGNPASCQSQLEYFMYSLFSITLVKSFITNLLMSTFVSKINLVLFKSRDINIGLLRVFIN